MNITFIKEDWENVFNKAIEDCTELRIICPYIKSDVTKKFLKDRNLKTLLVLTRFLEADFCSGASDTEALRHFLKHGATVHGIQNLHTKLYLFDSRRVILTSANLTKNAMNRNHEFGILSEETSIIEKCKKYFDSLWQKTKGDLTENKLSEMEENTAKLKREHPSSAIPPDMKDHGEKIEVKRPESKEKQKLDKKRIANSDLRIFLDKWKKFSHEKVPFFTFWVEPILGKQKPSWRVTPNERGDALVMQDGRFDGDEAYWKGKLSRPDLMKALRKGGKRLRFYLISKEDFEMFWPIHSDLKEKLKTWRHET